jgi:hypothetical protein
MWKIQINSLLNPAPLAFDWKRIISFVQKREKCMTDVDDNGRAGLEDFLYSVLARSYC